MFVQRIDVQNNKLTTVTAPLLEWVNHDHLDLACNLITSIQVAVLRDMLSKTYVRHLIV